MQDPDLFFVVPTYRLRDVGETIKQYGEHFWRNGHSVRLLVLDDSSPTQFSLIVGAPWITTRRMPRHVCSIAQIRNYH